MTTRKVKVTRLINLPVNRNMWKKMCTTDWMLSNNVRKNSQLTEWWSCQLWVPTEIMIQNFERSQLLTRFTDIVSNFHWFVSYFCLHSLNAIKRLHGFGFLNICMHSILIWFITLLHKKCVTLSLFLLFFFSSSSSPFSSSFFTSSLLPPSLLPSSN